MKIVTVWPTRTDTDGGSRPRAGGDRRRAEFRGEPLSEPLNSTVPAVAPRSDSSGMRYQLSRFALKCHPGAHSYPYSTDEVT
jgi:hypothetical protein